MNSGQSNEKRYCIELQFLLSQFRSSMPHAVLFDTEAKHKDSSAFNLQTIFNQLRNLSGLLAMALLVSC